MLDFEAQQILKELDSEKVKLTDIAERLLVSIDKVKRVSRYRNILLKAEGNICKNTHEKLMDLGFKALVFSQLVNKADWDGLSDILQETTYATTREQLTTLIQAQEKKRERVLEIEQSTMLRLSKLEEKEHELIEMVSRTKKLEEKIREETVFLQKWDRDVQDFLLGHLGIYDNELVLYKRIDSNWMKLLVKKGALKYDEDSFVWKVKKVSVLAEDYTFRMKRNYPVFWDYDREINKNKFYPVPTSPYYKLPHGLASDFREHLKALKDEVAAIEKQKVFMEEEISRFKRESPKSFIESALVANTLSQYDLATHAEMQNEALKWLYKRGYVAAAEVKLSNSQRVDVIGYNSSGRVIIIEVKVNRGDFLRDQKWKGYLKYCHEFYFLLVSEIEFLYDSEKYSPAGLLIKKDNKIVVATDFWRVGDNTLSNQENTIFQVNKTLSRKFIYGY